MSKLAPPGLRCPDPKCPNHEDTGDNNRFRGVQEGTRDPLAFDPTERDIKKRVEGFERAFVPNGPERFFCYKCGKEALTPGGKAESPSVKQPSATSLGKAESSDTLLPSAPERPIKSGETPQ